MCFKGVVSVLTPICPYLKQATLVEGTFVCDLLQPLYHLLATTSNSTPTWLSTTTSSLTPPCRPPSWSPTSYLVGFWRHHPTSPLHLQPLLGCSFLPSMSLSLWICLTFTLRISPLASLPHSLPVTNQSRQGPAFHGQFLTGSSG